MSLSDPDGDAAVVSGSSCFQNNPQTSFSHAFVFYASLQVEKSCICVALRIRSKIFLYFFCIVQATAWFSFNLVVFVGKLWFLVIISSSFACVDFLRVSSHSPNACFIGSLVSLCVSLQYTGQLLRVYSAFTQQYLG